LTWGPLQIWGAPLLSTHNPIFAILAAQKRVLINISSIDMQYGGRDEKKQNILGRS
jgi:hypothetical protein